MKMKIPRLLAVGLLSLGMLLPLSALANTAANTEIGNTVEVSFDDLDGNAQDPVTASVTISVNLVAAAPTVSEPATIDPAPETGDVDLIYTISANANGPDDYELSGESFVNTNMDGDPTITPPAAFNLGATTLIEEAASGQDQLVVPFDGATGTAGNGEVNGLQAGDMVVIGGELHEIASVDDVGSDTSNQVTITLVDNLAAVQPAGTVVGEQIEVTVTLTTNTVSDGFNSGTHEATVSFASQTDATASTDAAGVDVVVRVSQLEVSKLVRNVTSGTAGAGDDVTVEGNTYYSQGVSGDPGDTMEYLIVVSNPADSSEATNIVIEDSVPQFTTYEPGSLQIVASTDDLSTATFTAVTDSDDGNNDPGQIVGEEIVFYAGDDANTDGDGTGGSLTAERSSVAAFQVTID